MRKPSRCGATVPGRRLGAPGEPGDYTTNPALSPDGKRVAVGRGDRTTLKRDIWLLELERGTASRLTFDPADVYNSGVLLGSSQGSGNTTDIWLAPLDGDRKPLPLLVRPFSDWQAQISPDGRWIAYSSDASGPQEI